VVELVDGTLVAALAFGEVHVERGHIAAGDAVEDSLQVIPPHEVRLAGRSIRVRA
jgi:hypothetical protein